MGLCCFFRNIVCCASIMLTSSSLLAVWVANEEAGMLKNGEITVSFEKDKSYLGGIVLKKLIQSPNEQFSLNSLADIEKDTGLVPTTLGSCFASWNNNLVSYVLPASLRKIEDRAFSMCKKVRNVPNLPPELEEIGYEAFFANESAKGSIVIPKNIRVIEKNTFYGCGNAIGIHFTQGSKLERIEDGAFKRCHCVDGTLDLSICKNLKFIHPLAFVNCEPDRVIYGKEYRTHIENQLKASDKENSYPRASTDWFAGAFGIGVHWTTWSTAPGGGKNSFDEAVERFDVPRFVNQIKDAGADYIIFTSSWAEQHPPAPCEALDKILPGRTTKRNLLLEIAKALDAEGIRTILYYNHGCNGEDPEWMKAVGYSDNRLEDFGTNIVSIVRDLSLGCGEYVSGWWFDSPGTISNEGQHRVASVNLGDYKFPFRELALAAKAGNKDAIVSINSQGGTFLYSTCQEYFSGEELIYFPLSGRFNDQGMQMHIWCTMDNTRWVHQGPGFSSLRFNDEYLANFISKQRAEGCAITLNVDINRDGLLNPEAIEQIKRVLKEK